jgi:hypothetical protein
MITIVYGPARSGKTANKDALARKYGCTRVVDGWSQRDARELHDGDLVLTNEHPQAVDIYRRFRLGVHTVPIASALADLRGDAVLQ